MADHEPNYDPNKAPQSGWGAPVGTGQGAPGWPPQGQQQAAPGWPPQGRPDAGWQTQGQQQGAGWPPQSTNGWGTPGGGDKQRLTKLPSNGFARFLRKAWIPLACVAVLALVVLFFGSAIMLRVAPGWAVSHGMSKTGAAMKSRIKDSPYQALALFGSALNDGALTADFNYFDGWENDVTGRVRLNSDLEALDLSLAADVTVNGQQVDGELFFDRERVALRSSILPDCYGITFATFADDLRASALSDAMSSEELDALEDALDEFSDLEDRDMDSLMESYYTVLGKFNDQLEFESGSEKVKVGGERVSCGVVRTKIDGQMLRELLLDIWEATLDDPSVEDAYVATLAGQMGMSESEARRTYEGYCQQLLDSMDQELSAYDCDLDVNYCLYRDRVVQIQVTGQIENDGVPVDVEATLDFGCDPARDDWSGVLTLSNGSGDSILVEMSYRSESDGSDYRDELKLSAGAGGQSQRGVVFSTEWDRDSGDLVLQLDVDGQTERANCNLKVESDRCELRLDQFPGLSSEEQLELVFTAEKGAKVEHPDYVNLDRWDEDTLREIEESLRDAGLV